MVGYEYSEGIRNELEDQILYKKRKVKKSGVVTNRVCYDFTQCTLGIGPAERCCSICTSDYKRMSERCC